MKVSIYSYNRKFHKHKGSNDIATPLLFVFYCICLPVDKVFKKELNKEARLYKDTIGCANISRIKVKMLWTFASECFTPYEYRCYDFLNSTKEERGDFIPEESLKWTFKTDKRINTLPRNKFSRYKMFAELFHREIVCLSGINEVESEKLFYDFQNRHSEAIFKPLRGAQGKGVIKQSIEGLSYGELRGRIGTGDYMMEEVIMQGEELAKFHPSSINTIRYVTAMSPDGKYRTLYSMLRCGGGGSVVDNVGSGGYIMIINNGSIITDAMRGGDFYEIHPDSNVRFKGGQIPSWSELERIAEIAHKKVPAQRLFGWDFAWTQNGWDLVEVNPGPAVVSYQILMKKGLKPQFIEAGIL